MGEAPSEAQCEKYVALATQRPIAVMYGNTTAALPQYGISKADVTSPTKFFYEDGTEITLNQGKTWVCIIQDSYEDKVSFVEE